MRQTAWIGVGITLLIVVLVFQQNLGVAFTTIAVPSGTDPEATAGDTLVFAAGSGITITGDMTTDTITFTAAVSGAGAVAFDIGNNSVDDSTQIIRINTTGDTNSIFTESPDDEILIDFGNAVPTADALAANPADCAANVFADAIAANGDLPCNAIVDGDVPDTITIDLAATATALAADPSDCGANTKADSIVASGDLTCTGIDTGDIIDDEILEVDLDTVDAAVDEECLTFEDSNGGFEWQTCGSGSGSMTTVKEDGSQVGGADIVTLDFGTIFDLSESPDTEINISLDFTELAGITFGSGSGFTWTFDAGATDPTIAFASNLMTIGVTASFNSDILLEGATQDGNELIITTEDPGSDHTFRFPDDDLDDDELLVGSGSGGFEYKVLVDCDAANDALAYDDTGNSFTCSAHFLEKDAVFVQSGTLAVSGAAIENIRMYNNTGAVLVINDVRCSVNTAPTGATLIVDVNENGTTIFSTQANRPTIAASAFTDVSGAPDDTSFADGNFLQIVIAQVGSTIAGSDLTCQVTVRQAVFSSIS